MESVGAFFQGGGQTRFNSDALKSFGHLSPGVQKHLQKVYITLTAALLVAAVGAYSHLLFNLGGLLTHLGFLGCALWLGMSPPGPQQEGLRLKLLLGAAFCQGASVGSLIGVVLSVDPAILVTAFLSTTAIFLCFSGAATLAERRSYLFLGGILSSAVSVMMTMHLVTWLVGGRAAMFNVELYGGLVLFAGYILYDTQLVIEKAERGDRDYVKHAMELFVDFVAVFVRVLIILLQNSQKRESREEKKRGNTSRR